jgi:hypothetical protein
MAFQAFSWARGVEFCFRDFRSISKKWLFITTPLLIWVRVGLTKAEIRRIPRGIVVGDLWRILSRSL